MVVLCVKKGIILYLNGVTSAGKSTIAKEIQKKSELNFYHLSHDIFQQMVSPKFLRQNYFKHLGEAILQAYQTAKLMSDNGINIIYDGMILELGELKPHHQKIKTIFKDSNIKFIEVYCPLEICKQRNIERQDRGANQSEEQSQIMAKGVEYDISVDTSVNSAEQCAKIIINSIFNRP